MINHFFVVRTATELLLSSWKAFIRVLGKQIRISVLMDEKTDFILQEITICFRKHEHRSNRR